MKYSLAVFDMDGTLLDTLTDLAGSINYSLRTAGFPERPVNYLRRMIGCGMRSEVKAGLPEGATEEDIDKVLAILMEHYAAHCADHTCPYPGVLDLMKRLREAGCRIAVVSNKADSAVGPLCEQYFPGLVDFAVGERDDIRRKPAPDEVEAALKALNADKKDAVYIGDSEVDLQTAENSGLECLTVTWGFRDRDQLEESGAKIYCDTCEDLYREIIG